MEAEVGFGRELEDACPNVEAAGDVVREVGVTRMRGMGFDIWRKIGRPALSIRMQREAVRCGEDKVVFILFS